MKNSLNLLIARLDAADDIPTAAVPAERGAVPRRLVRWEHSWRTTLPMANICLVEEFLRTCA